MSVFNECLFFRDQYFLEVLFFRNRCFQRSVFLGRWIVFRNVSFSRKSRALFQAQEGGVGGDSGRFEAGVFLDYFHSLDSQALFSLGWLCWR